MQPLDDLAKPLDLRLEGGDVTLELGVALAQEAVVPGEVRRHGGGHSGRRLPIRLKNFGRITATTTSAADVAKSTGMIVSKCAPRRK